MLDTGLSSQSSKDVLLIVLTTNMRILYDINTSLQHEVHVTRLIDYCKLA